MNLSEIKNLLLRNDSAFWTRLKALTQQATEFDDLIYLSSLRKKAAARGLHAPAAVGAPTRLAILGGCSLYPLHELLTHLLETSGVTTELFLGDYDNYVSEIMEAGGPLYEFRPHVVLLLPGTQRCKYAGALTDARAAVQAVASACAAQLLQLCATVHERTEAEVLLGNFILPARRDLGEFRART